MIQINFLSFDVKRIDFSFISLRLLKKIKSENKKLIKLKLLVTLWGEVKDNEQRWKDIEKELNENDIDTELIFYEFSSDDYIKKIRYSITTDCEYSCSMDEDVLISNYTWDFLIENIEELNKDNTLFISPLISNGIPSTDIFVNEFTENENIKKVIFDSFRRVHIPNMWGVNFTTLNKHTIGSETWNWENFYDEVYRIQHYYRGIHPVRISYESNEKIMYMITQNLSKVFNQQSYDFIRIKRPYYCNSFYFIRTDVWRKIINDSSLFRDVFDEVPLNLYKDKQDMNMCFVKNGYCIHMSYNTINNRYNIEKEYVKKINEYFE